MLSTIDRFKETLNSERQKSLNQFETRRKELVARQRAERREMNSRLEQRQDTEQKQRQKCFRKGMRGLWGCLSGKHSRIKSQHERETYEAFVRGRTEKDALIFRHLAGRKRLELIRTREQITYQDQTQ